MPARPKDQPAVVTLICGYGGHPYEVPYAQRNRQFCSMQHANAAHAEGRWQCPAGYSTIDDLAERYGYSRCHIARLIAAGAIEAEYEERYLISAAQEDRAKRNGAFERGKWEKAAKPLVLARAQR